MKTLVQLALATLVAAGALAGASHAQEQWPSKPITIIVPFPAGGGTDTSIRLIAPKMGEILGQPVVVENRAGAKGTIGTSEVVKAEPDGHTFLVQTSGIAIDANLRKNLPYDVQADLKPVTNIAAGPYVLVTSNDVPANTIAEFVEYAKAHPGELNIGTSGIGASNHMSAELFKSQTGIDVVMVPYKGSGESMPALISNEYQATFQVTPSVRSLVESGKIKALAVTSLERNDALPDVPTFQEAGYSGYNDTIWFGMLAPAGTPDEIVGKMQAAVAEALDTPEMAEKYAVLGMTPVANTPAEFASEITERIASWKTVIEQAGITLAD